MEKKTTLGPCVSHGLPCTLTSVVTTSTARIAGRLRARHAGLDSYPVTDLEVGDTWSNLDDLARRLVAGSCGVPHDHGRTDLAVLPKVDVGAVVSGDVCAHAKLDSPADTRRLDMDDAFSFPCDRHWLVDHLDVVLLVICAGDVAGRVREGLVPILEHGELGVGQDLCRIVGDLVLCDHGCLRVRVGLAASESGLNTWFGVSDRILAGCYFQPRLEPRFHMYATWLACVYMWSVEWLEAGASLPQSMVCMPRLLPGKTLELMQKLEYREQ